VEKEKGSRDEERRKPFYKMTFINPENPDINAFPSAKYNLQSKKVNPSTSTRDCRHHESGSRAAAARSVGQEQHHTDVFLTSQASSRLLAELYRDWLMRISVSFRRAFVHQANGSRSFGFRCGIGVCFVTRHASARSCSPFVSSISPARFDNFMDN
jgi:hypothetical protein